MKREAKTTEQEGYADFEWRCFHVMSLSFQTLVTTDKDRLTLRKD